MNSDCNDDRLIWLITDFVPQLQLWQKENIQKFGCGALKKSFLSSPTYEGLCAATLGMVALVRDLLLLGLPCVSTRRISQDSLESFFGFQRSFGRRHDNPSIHEFGYRRNAIVLKRQIFYSSPWTEGSTPKRRRR